MINVLHSFGKVILSVLIGVFLAVTFEVVEASHQITGLSKTTFSSNSNDTFYIRVTDYGNINCVTQAACVVSEQSSAVNSITMNPSGGWDINTASITGTQSVSVMVQVTVQAHTHQVFINIAVVGPPPPPAPVDDVIIDVTSTNGFVSDGVIYGDKSHQFQFRLLMSREGSSGYTEVSPGGGWIISPSTAGVTINSSGLLVISNTLPDNRQFTVSASYDSFSDTQIVRARAKFPESMTLFMDGVELIAGDPLPVFDENISPAAIFSARLNYDNGTSDSVATSWSTADPAVANINSTGQMETRSIDDSNTPIVLTSLSSTYYPNSSQYYPDIGNGLSFTLSFVIVNVLPFDSVIVKGPQRVFDQNSTGYQYKAFVVMPDSSQVQVNPAWSVTDLSDQPISFAQIDQSGVLTTNVLSQTENVLIKAVVSYLGETITVVPPPVEIIKPVPLEITISGASIVDEKSASGYQYTANATLQDSSSSQVNPEWSVTDLLGQPTSHAQIDELGILTTNEVSQVENILVNATFMYSDGVGSDQQTVTIDNSEKILDGISIEGPSELVGGSSANYTVMASFTDGSSSSVDSNEISWSISDTSVTSIATSGDLNTANVNQNMIVTLQALYHYNGVTKKVEKNVLVTYEVGSVLKGSATGNNLIEVIDVSSEGALSNLGGSQATVSSDGRYVAFLSAGTNLVGANVDTNGFSDVFVRNLETGFIERVNLSSSPDRAQADDESLYAPSISADGRYVAFTSKAANLVENDGNGLYDIFVHDRDTGETERVNVPDLANQATLGAQASGGHSYTASISADGRYVAFQSYATNLVIDDTNKKGDIFVHDRNTGVTERVSLSSSGAQAIGDSFVFPSISADGRYVVFSSNAYNLISSDVNGSVVDVFRHDRVDDETIVVNVNRNFQQGSGNRSSISADGRYVAFYSTANNLLVGEDGADINNLGDIFVRDIEGNSTELISVSSDGLVQANASSSGSFSISPDGRYVAFTSDATNLVGDDTNGFEDVFVHDRLGNITERVNVLSNGTQANGDTSHVSISSNARNAIFVSQATNLDELDSSGTLDDIYIARFASNAHVSLTAVDNTVSLGNQIVVEIHMSSGEISSIGGALNINYNSAFLDFISFTPSLELVLDPVFRREPDITTSGVTLNGLAFGDFAGIEGSNLIGSLTFNSLVAGMVEITVGDNRVTGPMGGIYMVNGDLTDELSFSGVNIFIEDNAVPVAASLSIATNERTAVADFMNAIDGDTGEQLSYVISGAPSKGEVTIDNPTTGAFTYSPSIGQTGTDTFTYLASDGKSNSAPATVTVAINGNPQPPVSDDGTLNTTEDSTGASGVLTASDFNADPLTYRIVTNGSRGTATINNVNAGDYSYVPDPNEFGSDTFTFVANDGTQDSLVAATITVLISPVNDTPVASNGVLSTNENVVYNGALVATDADSPALTYRIGINGSKGMAEILDANTGVFKYTPTANANGSDSFTFIANDDFLDSNIATVNVTINPVNDPPVPGGNNFTASEDLLLGGMLEMSDPDGDPLTYSIVTNGALGTVVINNTATGAFNYTPNLNANGVDTFSFIANDGTVDSAIATATVTIAAVNDAPMAIDGVLSTAQNVAGSGTLSASDIDGDALAFTIATNGSLGTATITNAATGAYTYTPDEGMAGTDSFSFSVNDGSLNSNTATVSVTIDAPVGSEESSYDYAWSNPFGGTRQDYAKGVATDAAGNVYVTGYFYGTVDFDISAASDSHSAASYDVYVTKLNADGSYGWTQTFGGTSSAYGYGISVDDLGNVYVAGTFYNSVDFDPGVGVDNHNSVSGADVFVTRLNADGSYGWTHTFDGDFSSSASNVIALDNAGNVVVTGSYAGTVDFDLTGTGDTHTSNGGNDIFLTKLGADGSYGWTRTIGGSGADDATAVAVDASNNIYVTGGFSNTVDFDAGAGVDQQSSSGGNDIFVMQYLPDGSYGWANTIAGVNSNHARSIAADANNAIYITGLFKGTVDFDSGAGVDNHADAGNYNMFVSKLGTDGSYRWTRTLGSSTFSLGRSVVVGQQGDLFVGGMFTGTVDFDPGVGDDSYSSHGSNYDAYMTHFKADGSYGWTKAVGSNNYRDEVTGIAVDPMGSVIQVGVYFDTGIYTYGWVDFDPGPNDDSYRSKGRTDAFVTKWQFNQGSGSDANLDSDGDGYLDTNDAFPSDPTEWLDTDGDLMGNNTDLDDDNDGMPDDYELTYGFDPLNSADASLDSDGDGINNLDEFLQGSDPTISDAAMTSSYTYGWSNPFGGTRQDYAKGVATDAAGNIYVTGYFYGTVDFDISAASDSHSAASYDVYVTKLNADGSYGWTQTFGGTSSAYGYGISVDDLGNVYVAGTFYNSVDFDPGVGVDNHNSVSGADVFVTRLNADGSYGWTHTFDGDFSSSASNVIALDNAGNVVVTGSYAGTVDFDLTGTGDTHTSNGGNDIFLTKLGADGSYGWTRTIGGSGADDATAVAVDASNNIYVTGGFSNTVDFDAGAGVDQQSSSGGNDIFVMQYLPDGSYGWANTIAGVNSNHARSIAADANNAIYITGLFKGTVDFDSGAGVDNHADAGNYNMFVSKLGTDGSYRWTRTLGSSTFSLGRSVVVGQQGDLFVGGMFTGTVDFDPGVGDDSYSSHGSNYDAYMTHFKADGSYGWTKAVGSNNYRDEVTGIAVDPMGSVIQVGVYFDTGIYIYGWVDFDPGPNDDSYRSKGRTDAFVTKWNNSLVPTP